MCQMYEGLEETAKLLPIAVASVLTNGLVFLLFYKQKSLRSSSNYLLLGLAICDFLTGAVNIPYYLVLSFRVVPQSIVYEFYYWMVVQHMLVAISTAYHLLFITAEKYLAIVRPLRRYVVTKKTVLKVIATIWVVSGCIATIQYAWREETPHRNTYEIVYGTACLVIVFVVPYVFMVYAYTVMLKKVRGRKRPPSRNKDKMQKVDRNDGKCILIFALMAAIYLCCWFPYFTLTLALRAELISAESSTVCNIAEAFMIIRFLTSVTNPLLYAFFKRDFWLSLRSLCLKRKSRSTELKRSATSRTRYSNVSLGSTAHGKGFPDMELQVNHPLDKENIVWTSSV
ncbi:RYamide receptor-like [Montipora capricornis]|uniref:RYamide receptor-like n=1 Tax=Montipora capricornis TaxID=246305 RepID=UPI0035F17599